MCPSSSDSITSGVSKGAKSAKEGKPGKELKEGKNNALLKQIASEIEILTRSLNILQSDVDTLKGLSAGKTSAVNRKKSKSGAYSFPDITPEAFSGDDFRKSGSAIGVFIPAVSDTDEDYLVSPTGDALQEVDTASIARVGYAFSSIPKISLLRLLLEQNQLSASQLGEGAGLTSGSLYHHLRELVHSGVAEQVTRNLYSLTPQGRRLLLAILALTR